MAEKEVSQEASAPPDLPARNLTLALLVDNVRSTFNVGSIFRCADGAGVAHLYLCGVTPTPAHRKVAKTALGAQESVGWSYHTNAVDLAAQLKATGWQLWALEESPAAESLFAVQPGPADNRLVLVIGNEVTGVDPGVLARCDRTLSIPMRGAKRSLNVAIAFGIAAYSLAFSPSFAPTVGIE
jgi:tRNA G18 (ribose-2'-O)-methylase SpoU